MSNARFLVLVALVGLTACGGDGSSGGTPVVTAPTPTPSSTPTPSPNPTPTPTPINYDIAFDFSHDFSFFGPTAVASYNFLYDYMPVINAEITTQPNYGVFYSKSDGILDTVDAFFSDSLLTTNTAIERHYVSSPTARTGSFTYSRPSVDFRYSALGHYALPLGRVVGTAQNVTTATYRYHLIGVPTLVADLPKAGIATYPIRYQCTLLSGESVSESTDIGASMAVDFATGAVSATISNDAKSCLNNGSVVRPASLLFSGSFNNSTNQITGTISSPDSNFTGSFSGKVFGPNAVEAGFVFVVRNGSDAFVSGQVVGRRS